MTKVFECPGDEMHGQPLHVDHHDGGFGTMGGVIVPDFRDDGTVGHLLGQVRRACPADVSQWPNNEPAWTIADHGQIPCPECNGSGAADCERCEGEGAVQSREITGWACGVPGGRQFFGLTEVEALLAARKAAPK